MKRTLAILAVLSIGALAAPSTAQAGDWGFRVGYGPHGGSVGVHYNSHRKYRRYERHYRGNRGHYRHSRGHRYVRRACPPRRVWIEPVYQTVFAGYDSCGEPIYRRICVRRGYWSY